MPWNLTGQTCNAKTPGGSQGSQNSKFRLAQRQVRYYVSVRTPVATKLKHQLPTAARCMFQITIQHMQSTRRKMIPVLQSHQRKRLKGTPRSKACQGCPPNKVLRDCYTKKSASRPDGALCRSIPARRLAPVASHRAPILGRISTLHSTRYPKSHPHVGEYTMHGTT